MGGNSLAIHYKSLLMDPSPMSASVRISKYLKCKSDSTCEDFDPCATSKCINYDRYGEGICSYSEIACDLCGTSMSTSFRTNEFPENLSWRIERADKNRIISTSKADLSVDTTYDESKCVAFGTYKFIVSYTENITYPEMFHIQ